MSILQEEGPQPLHLRSTTTITNKNDWIILVEAGTIVGPSVENEKLRVAQATLKRKNVVKK